MNQTNQTNQISMRDRSHGLIVADTAETGGTISYWRIASDTSLATLTAAWQRHGLDVAALPTPVKDEVALGRAVADQAGKRRLVRPLARRGAWAIVDETAVEGQPPTYSTRVMVRFEQGRPVTTAVDANGAEYEKMRTELLVAFGSHQARLAHSDISSWLLDIGAKLGSVSLRDSGGVYFIPRKNVELWNKVASALEEAGSVIFRIPAMRTEEAVAAITDAISAEAVALTEKMEAELLAEGDDVLGKRALKTRMESATALLDKLSTYEELIGKQLDIRKRVELLSANVTALALTADTAAE